MRYLRALWTRKAVVLDDASLFFPSACICSTRPDSIACSLQTCPRSEVSSIYLMVKDQYANYVVQKMLDVAEEPLRQQLLSGLRPHVSALKRYTYGKHIISKVERQPGSASASDAPTPTPDNGKGADDTDSAAAEATGGEAVVAPGEGAEAASSEPAAESSAAPADTAAAANKAEEKPAAATTEQPTEE